MYSQISEQAMAWKMAAGVIGVILPIILLVFWKKKTGGKIMPALAGAVIFVVFAQVLESIPKMIFFMGDTELTNYVWTHTWIYVLLGCLMAGVFEEVGRFVAFRFLLKKYQNKTDAVMYGIGHGGIESIIILGIGAVSSIAMAAVVNSGMLEETMGAMSLGQTKSVELQVTALASYGLARFILEIAERIFAMTLHIALSVLVFQSVRAKKPALLFLAIVFHGIFDIPAALYQCGAIALPVAEVFLFIEALCVAAFSAKIYRRMS